MPEDYTIRSFALKVKEMRKAQSKFFAISRKYSVKKEDRLTALHQAQKLEQEVDEQITQILISSSQQSLF
jgi:hypothetical protein